MTAQIVILNRFCAVVASDSAVTLSMGDGRQRTFPTADKIFALPGPHNLAVLHSGNTDFLGVPYSVLLGEWVDSLANQPLEFVAAYVESWSNWLNQQKNLLTDDVQRDYLNWLLRDYYLAIRGQLLAATEEAGLDQSEWDSEKARSVVQEVLSRSLDYLRAQSRMPGWDETDVDTLLQEYSNLKNEAREWVFDDAPRSAEGDHLLDEIAKQLLLVVEPFSRDAVLAFVGFGSSQWFPSTDKRTFQGMVSSRLRASDVDHTEISVGMTASIIPLAQTEAVHTFLDGYNASFLSEAHDQLGRLLDEVRAVFPETSLQVEQIGADAHTRLDERFHDISWTTFVQPMIDTVASLPPIDIARMAESLVGLQILRELTRAEAETVGGPIDVAVLTRSSGVQWIRQKTAGVTGPSTLTRP